jgi:hypothetical protein
MDLWHKNYKVSLNHTLPKSLHYSTHKVFKSHVKFSQTNFLYSSVLLKLTACLLYSSAYDCAPADNCLLTQSLTISFWVWISYIDAERTRTRRKYVTWYPHSLLRDVTAPAPAVRTRREHVMWHSRCCCWRQSSFARWTDTENTASSTIACAYFGDGLDMTFIYCCLLERVYGAVAWQWVFTLQYEFSKSSYLSKPRVSSVTRDNIAVNLKCLSRAAELQINMYRPISTYSIHLYFQLTRSFAYSFALTNG